jgi:hypothetical protein
MKQLFPIKFGDAGQYELSERALAHILWGDTAIRPLRGPAGRTLETALSGGLHTWAGWKKFVTLHPRVVHLLQYRVDLHDDWFYARELQNGVITLKIPRRLYTGDAASITRQPDLHYKSGYLWKTVYPASYTQETILRVIGEALQNIDQEDSTPPTAEMQLGVIYGYANVHEPLSAIKLRIQIEGNQIRSAFPAWEQPYTGNNGKPYSHEHSISFLIATSTVEYANFQVVYGPAFPGNTFDLRGLVMQTPSFIRARRRRDMIVTVDAWQANRMKDLEQVAASAAPEDLHRIESYLGDYVCAKDPFWVQHELYANCLDLICAESEIFNVAQLTENVGECIVVLALCDRRLNTRRAIDATVRFLRMAVVHTGGLNTLMFKRLLGRMLKVVLEHQDASALKDFLAALAGAPCRAALYTEFDLNPFVKKNDQDGLAVIGLPHIELELKPEHLLEFVALNLGENYLAFFSKERRLAIASKMLDSPGMLRMAEDTMSLFVGSDFDFFMPAKLELQERGTRTTPAEDDLLAIAKDYSRMLVLLRQHIVLEDPDAYMAEPDFAQWGTQAFFELTRQKHKRRLVMAMHEAALTNLITFANSVGYQRLNANCGRMLLNLPEERVPVPKPIPDYIISWQTTAERRTYDVKEIVTRIFGEVPEGDE